MNASWNWLPSKFELPSPNGSEPLACTGTDVTGKSARAGEDVTGRSRCQLCCCNANDLGTCGIAIAHQKWVNLSQLCCEDELAFMPDPALQNHVLVLRGFPGARASQLREPVASSHKRGRLLAGCTERAQIKLELYSIELFQELDSLRHKPEHRGCRVFD